MLAPWPPFWGVGRRDSWHASRRGVADMWRAFNAGQMAPPEAHSLSVAVDPICRPRLPLGGTGNRASMQHTLNPDTETAPGVWMAPVPCGGRRRRRRRYIWVAQL